MNVNTSELGAKLSLRIGDLFESEAHAIGHGVNCRGLMGAGIAVLFRKRHPGMYKRYAELCALFEDDLAGSCYLYFDGEYSDGYVANIFSQKKPGANAEVGILVNGVREAFIKLYSEAEIDRPHLAIPLIGCGIGGLDWFKDVKPALENLLSELPKDWTLTVYSLEPLEGFSE